MISIEDFFDIIKYLSQEESFAPWNVALGHFGYLVDMLESSSLYPKFQKYLLNLITPTYERLGWTEGSSDNWLDK